MFLVKISALFTAVQLTHCVIFTVGPGPPGPPEPSQVAKMARYILRNSEWVSVATTSTLQNITHYPFVSLKSVSDGPESNSTGIPYLYMTTLDVTGKDIESDDRCTILATLAESDYCKQKNFDPQDPRCAKLIITGKMVEVDNTTAEYKFGEDALFYKHPSMKWWPKDHQFFVAKVNIEQIAVLDFFGGIKYVSVQDYFNANNTPDDIPFDQVDYIVVTA